MTRETGMMMMMMMSNAGERGGCEGSGKAVKCGTVGARKQQ